MCLRYHLWRLRNSDVFFMAGEKPLGWILLNVPVSDGVQVATLNLGDYLFFSVCVPKDALDLFHLSESAVKSKIGRC